METIVKCPYCGYLKAKVTADNDTRTYDCPNCGGTDSNE